MLAVAALGALVFAALIWLGLRGQPKGLSTLFFTEMWERFSYYGMRAILILFMVASVDAGGLGFDTRTAAGIYGTYTGSVYFTAIFGGWIADRLLGLRRAVLVGGILIALGHYSMAVHSLRFFYAGLVLIVLGTGLLKPNISSIVGQLYEEEDPHRDAGFSVFYMGINLGAFISPLVCGFMAQDPRFLGLLASLGIESKTGWHWGFGAAGVGMTLGLLQYVLGRKRLGQAGLLVSRPVASTTGPTEAPVGFTAVEKKRLAAIGVLFVFATLFWGAFEQAGSSLNLFAAQYTRNSILGWEFPSSWLQSVNSLFIILLAPVFAWLWLHLGRREPSSPAKFAYGLVFVGLGFAVLAIAAHVSGPEKAKVSPFWLIALYLCHTIGELSLSPVGLSTVTKLAPARIVGLMMGVWFLALSLGNFIGGQVAGLFGSFPLPQLFGAVFLTTTASALVLALLVKPIRGLMGGVH